MSPVERPKAPATRASARSADIRPCSSADGGRGAKHWIATRKGRWATKGTSARTAGPPVPSRTSPPRISQSNAMGRWSGLGRLDLHALHPVSHPDLVDELHPAPDLAEDGVLAVERRLGAEADVELAPRR